VRPLFIGPRLCVIGLRPVVIGHRPLVIGLRPVVIGHRPLVIGLRPVVIGEACITRSFSVHNLLATCAYRVVIVFANSLLC